MAKVRIARLKARLSHYLRRVRKGETFTVYYRDTPVADLVPHRRLNLKIRPPVPGSPPLHEVPLPDKPLLPGIDIVDLLLEDRERK